MVVSGPKLSKFPKIRIYAGTYYINGFFVDVAQQTNAEINKNSDIKVVTRNSQSYIYILVAFRADG